MAAFFNLGAIAQAASATYLITYVAVQIAHWRLRRQTNGSLWLIIAGLLLMLVVLAAFGLASMAPAQPATPVQEDSQLSQAAQEAADAAETMGVPTFKYNVWAFAIGASVGGLSGALFAGQVGFDYMLDKHWGVNFDVKKLFLEPDWKVDFNGAPLTGKAKLNPWLVGAGVTYRF